jgi:chemotaxis protein CheD
VVTHVGRETLVAVGHQYITHQGREILKAIRVATSVVVTIFDPTSGHGGMVHMALPDSRMATNPGETSLKYVDLALPKFIRELLTRGLNRELVQAKIIGGSQLFNFGGGSGNLLNIGTRNVIIARTLLNREGIQVEKTETGGNKPRTVLLDMENGYVQVFHPGESPRFL